MSLDDHRGAAWLVRKWMREVDAEKKAKRAPKVDRLRRFKMRLALNAGK